MVLAIVLAQEARLVRLVNARARKVRFSAMGHVPTRTLILNIVELVAMLVGMGNSVSVVLARHPVLRAFRIATAHA